MKTKLIQSAAKVILISILFINDLFSQDVWLPVNGPYGGPVYEFFNGNSPYDFCITPSGLFRSSNSGEMWHQSSTLEMKNLYKGDVDNIGNIYAATTNYTTLLYRSTDNGNTWHQSLDGGLDFNAVTASPNGTVFAGTFYMFSFHGQFIQDGDIYRSTDRGATWSVMNFPPLAIGSLKINSNSEIFVGTTDGLFKSLNNGASFSLIRSGSVGSIFISVQNHVYIYTTGNTVFRSTDNGGSWTLISSGSEPKVPISEDAAGNIFSIAEGGIHKSTDFGSNWTLFSELPGNSYYEVSSLNFMTSGNIVLTTSRGIFRSSDNGVSWSKANNGLRDPQVRDMAVKGQTMFTSSYSNISRSLDNGNTWLELSAGLPDRSANDIETGDEGIVFANIPAEGLYRSLDNGNLWTHVESIPSNIHISQIKTLTGNKIFVTTENGTLLRSINNGDNWVDVTSNLPDSLQFLAFTNDSWGNLYVSIQRSSWTNPLKGIYASVNEGATWTLLNSDYSPQEIKFGLQNIMFIKIGTSLLRSTNGGASFDPTTSAGDNVLDFEIGSSGQIFISAVKNEIYKVEKSTDNGQTWQDNTGILDNQLIYDLKFDSNSHLIAATQSGLYRTSSPTSIISSQSDLPGSFHLNQNYPNPFNPVTKISYQLRSDKMVTLKVFDVSGKEVAELVNGFQNAGHHSITFDGTGFSSGIYFYTLSSEGIESTKKMLLIK